MADLLKKEEIAAFRRKIWRFYRRYSRDLPFRKTDDPYKIAVAEIMLQQTQVERVIDKYLAWISRWPSWKDLATASRRELLTAWSGLGYNRRAVYLNKMARIICRDYDGRLPETPEELRRLPGIGPYTSRAILIFAFNKNLITIDTNIRRVLIHELDLSPEISSSKLEEIASRLLPRGRARDWHNALMDYSRLALPKSLAAIPPVSKQSPFEGSLRQIRGEIIRRLTTHRRVALTTIAGALDRDIEDVRRAAQSLAVEGIVAVGSSYITLCD